MKRKALVPPASTTSDLSSVATSSPAAARAANSSRTFFCHASGAFFGFRTFSAVRATVQPLSPESREVYRSGNRFTTNLLGKEIVWRLCTGSDALAMKRRSKKRKGDPDYTENPLADGLEMRIVSVEGIKDRDERALRLWLEDLDFEDFGKLLAEFDRHDCGLETSLDVKCSDCNHVQEIELPFDRGFFFPRTKKKTDQSTNELEDATPTTTT